MEDARGRECAIIPIPRTSEGNSHLIGWDSGKTISAIAAIDPDTLPADKKETYWGDRHIARAAWEHAENAAFENLVDQQKQELLAVTASNAKLAKDMETTATVIGVLNLVSAALGILASVITLLRLKRSRAANIIGGPSLNCTT